MALRAWSQAISRSEAESLIIENVSSTQYAATGFIVKLTIQPPSWSEPSEFEIYFPSNSDINPTISEQRDGRIQALAPIKIIEIGEYIIRACVS